MIPHVSYDSYYNETQHFDLDAATTFTDAEMEAMVFNEVQECRLHLEIAAMHEFVSNPQVVSMAQSTLNRSVGVTKQSFSDVSKKTPFHAV